MMTSTTALSTALDFDAYPASEVNALAPYGPALATKIKSNTDFVHPFRS